VACTVLDGKRSEQVADNCRASGLLALTPEAMAEVKQVYDQKIGALVHAHW
jgi:hypothetical protein